MAELAGIAHYIWDQKYRYKNNAGEPIDTTVEDTFKRVAVALAAPEEQSSKWAQNFYEVLEDFSVLPGGRIFAGAGTDRDVSLINCFSGDEKLLTQEFGPMSFSEVVGSAVTVLTAKGWAPASIEGFGVQQLNKVEFQACFKHPRGGWRRGGAEARGV